MNLEKHAPRLLGAAFLFVFIASVLSGQLAEAATGSAAFGASPAAAELLANVAANLTTMRLSILVELFNVAGIVVLAALLYIVLRHESRILALVALGWWLVEATALAISQIGAAALIPLSAEYAAGAPAAAVAPLAAFLHNGVDKTATNIHMLFFCLGALVWYALLYRSRVVPRLLAGWGLVAVFLVTIGSLLLLYDPQAGAPIWLYVAYIPFEGVIGLWLLVRGAPQATVRPATAAPQVAPGR